MIASTLERDLIEAEEELKSLDGERMVRKMEQIRLLKGRLEEVTGRNPRHFNAGG